MVYGLVMGCVMTIVMLSFMWSMYRRKGRVSKGYGIQGLTGMEASAMEED
jgi:hypothetical protein